MTSAVKKLTLTRIAAHDFNRALRAWRKQRPAHEIMGKLISEQQRTLNVALRALGLAVIAMLWLRANKAELALKVSLIDITIPAAYVNFVVALLLLSTLLHLVSYFMLVEFCRIAANKLFKFDGSALLAPFLGDSSVWSTPLVVQYRFFESGSVHARLGNFTAFFITFPMLMIIALCIWTVATVGLRVLVLDGAWSTSGIFTIVGWMLVLYGLAMVVIIHLPFTFSRNTTFIRWNFLTPMYRRRGDWPPRVDSWIAEGKARRAKLAAKPN